ncbi:hypothetical protein [Legionella sp. km772]|uniref:hypothetical protein n=1 Tax=Legionella sp. km772 TaxID=2498111 RepID=UPI000F8F21CF|nr:hypothetical protein [Legionella sp. km772]RUR12704.1 hypothetical protein ELY15_04235 [Legionella sp. km772]
MATINPEFYKQAQTKHSFDAILELNGAIATENRMNGVNELNRGGDGLFLLTGIRENYKSETSAILCCNTNLAPRSQLDMD